MHNQHITVLAKNYMVSLHGEFKSWLPHDAANCLFVWKKSTPESSSGLISEFCPCFAFIWAPVKTKLSD